ncbi:helix-turn-helix transcriptional regulator [Myxococcus sp. RHSTA-1-4]|uniref:helix-turn-helix transcriptional regulator n=1 Tax=Myxococcus sp. RHSTA-1-4 TaxID=2874601 RepID=UPI001CBAC783|nr:helix-turn-helix transcriptional regulator [Myxococcus sp. RHSTA-1-4]MBZ4416009.1 helix-turn-helix transcriptional regulator [Myxococcus sp. RHSTA-1-4]
MKTELGIHLGMRLREARKLLGLTQADVAEQLGLAREVYARLERGQMLPSLTTLRAVCKVLRVPPHEALALDMAFDMAPGRRRKPLAAPEKEPAALRELRQKLEGMSRSELRLLNMIATALPHRPRGNETPREREADEDTRPAPKAGTPPPARRP